MNDTFYIDDCSSDSSFPIGLLGYLLVCPTCNRKIVVQCGLNGTCHNVFVTATCAECINPNEEFRSKFPKVVDQLEKFKN